MIPVRQSPESSGWHPLAWARDGCGSGNRLATRVATGYNVPMRRASALSVLAAIGYLLIAPLTLASPESNLPACCRRAGAHHCAMAAEAAPSTGPAFQPVPSKCPFFPAAVTTPVAGSVTLSGNAVLRFGLLVSHPAAQAPTEARGRICFSRSHQKRGPPLNLS